MTNVLRTSINRTIFIYTNESHLWASYLFWCEKIYSINSPIYICFQYIDSKTFINQICPCMLFFMNQISHCKFLTIFYIKKILGSQLLIKFLLQLAHVASYERWSKSSESIWVYNSTTHNLLYEKVVAKLCQKFYSYRYSFLYSYLYMGFCTGTYKHFHNLNLLQILTNWSIAYSYLL